MIWTRCYVMKDKEKNFVSAVIYVHNAEKRIDEFLKTVIQILENHFEHSEIICVNDASTDRSLSKIKEACGMASTTSISVVEMSYFHGLELAMNAGVDLSIGDLVFEFDNIFLDFDPSVVMEVYRKSLSGYDIVSASPERRERISSRIFYKVFAHYSDLPYEMTTESFRVLSRRVINRISSTNRMIPYRKAVYANCGLKVSSVKYSVIADRDVKLNQKEKRYRSELAMDSLLLFTGMGYSFSKLMTIVMMFFSLFMVIYSIVIYITANPVAGWTTTILFLSMSFFGLFGILTAIIKYLQLLVDLVFKRKHYSFVSIEKLTK